MSTISREPVTHDLKIYPEYFSAVCTGAKRAELRKNDRDYRAGDTLHLMETPRGSCHATGEFINVIITHVADVGEWMPGYVLLSIALASLEAEPAGWHVKKYGGNWVSIKKEDVDHYRFNEELPVREVYTAPPAPASVHNYPETLPCPVMLEPGLRFGKAVKTHLVLEALKRRAEYYAELEAMTPEQRAEHETRIKECSAMLQGADGNSSVIADGWVACSERMPGSQEWVIVFAKWANQQVLCWDDVQSRWTDFEDQSYYADMFSHWMPLPAAPQQEVK